MKALHQWLDEYSECHQDPQNIQIHTICVPAIVWSLLGLLYLVPVAGDSITLAHLLAIAALIFYARLHMVLAILMFLFTALCFQTYMLLNWIGLPLLPIFAIVFVAAWIGQFVGHNIEGKKPSFFEDIQFLLIGPVWTLYKLVPERFLPDRE